jgi:hypothetical protein
MVMGKEFLVNDTEAKVTLADLIQTARASAIESLLRVLSKDLEHQMAIADEACTRDECVMAQGAAAYIRELRNTLGPRGLH